MYLYLLIILVLFTKICQLADIGYIYSAANNRYLYYGKEKRDMSIHTDKYKKKPFRIIEIAGYNGDVYIELVEVNVSDMVLGVDNGGVVGSTRGGSQNQIFAMKMIGNNEFKLVERGFCIGVSQYRYKLKEEECERNSSRQNFKWIPVGETEGYGHRMDDRHPPMYSHVGFEDRNNDDYENFGRRAPYEDYDRNSSENFDERRFGCSDSDECDEYRPGYSKTHARDYLKNGNYDDFRHRMEEKESSHKSKKPGFFKRMEKGFQNIFH